MFTVGEKVFRSNYGHGVVTDVDESALWHPVEVTFYDGYVEWFTQGGRQFIMEDQPSLVKVWE